MGTATKGNSGSNGNNGSNGNGSHREIAKWNNRKFLRIRLIEFVRQ